MPLLFRGRFFVLWMFGGGRERASSFCRLWWLLMEVGCGYGLLDDGQVWGFGRSVGWFCLPVVLGFAEAAVMVWRWGRQVLGLGFRCFGSLCC